MLALSSKRRFVCSPSHARSRERQPPTRRGLPPAHTFSFSARTNLCCFHVPRKTEFTCHHPTSQSDTTLLPLHILDSALHHHRHLRHRPAIRPVPVHRPSFATTPPRVLPTLARTQSASRHDAHPFALPLTSGGARPPGARAQVGVAGTRRLEDAASRCSASHSSASSPAERRHFLLLRRMRARYAATQRFDVHRRRPHGTSTAGWVACAPRRTRTLRALCALKRSLAVAGWRGAIADHRRVDCHCCAVRRPRRFHESSASTRPPFTCDRTPPLRRFHSHRSPPDSGVVLTSVRPCALEGETERGEGRGRRGGGFFHIGDGLPGPRCLRAAER